MRITITKTVAMIIVYNSGELVKLTHIRPSVPPQFYANPEEDEGYGPVPPEPAEDNLAPTENSVNGHWDKRLNTFHKLMFIKAFKEEMVGGV